MIRFIIAFTLLFGANITRGQNLNTIEQHIADAPHDAGKTVQKLSDYINLKAHTPDEKIWSYYLWITHHIVYDTKTFFSANPNPKTSAEDVLKYHRAICQGYSELFKALCDFNDIPCFLISGYSKGYGYKPGKKFTNADHAWNAVFADNKWQFIDATWGGGYIDENRKFVQKFFPEYFLTKPQEFILKHLPADPMWQLLTCPISINDYQQSNDAIIKKIKDCHGDFNFNDTIAAWQKLKPIEQKMASAERAFRFNPENVEVPGFALLQLSYDMGNDLKTLYDEKNYSGALELNNTILELNEKALKYLRQSKTPAAQKAAEVCKQNISSTKENIKSLKGFMK